MTGPRCGESRPIKKLGRPTDRGEPEERGHRLQSAILAITLRAITGWLRKKAKIQGVKDSAKSGTVTLIQRFSGSLFFAFIYYSLGVPIAAGVLYLFFPWLLNPMIASAGMSLSSVSVSVIGNALRLRKLSL